MRAKIPRTAKRSDEPAAGKWLVKDWMTATVYTVAPDDFLVDAVELMRIHPIRHLPVVATDARLVGIVSDRDVRHALPARAGEKPLEEIAYGQALLHTQISTIMTPRPLTIEPDASIREAAELMCREKIGALPVIEDGQMKGILSAEDLLWAFVDNTCEFEE